MARRSVVGREESLELAVGLNPLLLVDDRQTLLQLAAKLLIEVLDGHLNLQSILLPQVVGHVRQTWVVEVKHFLVDFALDDEGSALHICNFDSVFSASRRPYPGPLLFEVERQ